MPGSNLNLSDASWIPAARLNQAERIIMSDESQSCIIRLTDAERQIPTPAGEHALSLFEHVTLNLKLSKPVPPNRQTPHEQDELYIVVRGRGELIHNGLRAQVETGDVMFIAAGTEHHVENFSDDLSVWVVFYGPKGGEAPASLA